MSEEITWADGEWVLLPRDSIRPNPDQPRQSFPEEEMNNLRESIRRHGVLQPILVRHEPSRYDGTKFVLVGGERRWRASEGVLESIPCIVKNVSKEEAEMLSFVENIQRRDLTAMEEAREIRKIMEREPITVKDLAARLDKSQGWVNNRIAFMKVQPDVKAVGERVTKKMSALLQVDKVTKPEVRKDLLEEIETREIPFVEVKARVDAALEAEAAAKRAAEFVKRSQQAAERETQMRVKAVTDGGIGMMSRGKLVTGGPKKSEANIEVIRSINNLKAWAQHCDDETFAKVLEFARSVTRGELKRN